MSESGLTEYIAAHIEISPSGCWVWTGSLDKNRYGRMKVLGKYKFAHRLSYEAHIGPIGDGLVIDHLCRNTMCVNPNHLEPVTLAINTKRGERANKLYCKSGHSLFGENLYVVPGRIGRACRTCNRAAVKRYLSRKQHEKVLSVRS